MSYNIYHEYIREWTQKNMSKRGKKYERTREKRKYECMKNKMRAKNKKLKVNRKRFSTLY
jgi:hypothetical protein